METSFQSLPRTPVDCDSELICTIESIPRSSVPLILSRLSRVPSTRQPSVSSIHNSTFYNSQMVPSTSNLPIIIGFSRPRYKSISDARDDSMDDSGCFDVDSFRVEKCIFY